MLDYLKVENFAVVEKAELHFSPHLNVLTGETGAGKSILIGAVNHFLNKKVADNAIRGDEEKMVVEAMFSEGDDELILRREVNRKKSFCFVNGNMVPFSQLKEKADRLFNIYGQNEHVFLLNPNNHRLFLDQFCENAQLLDNVAREFATVKVLIEELDALKNRGRKAHENLDFINFQIEEIDGLKMKSGDDEVMEQQLKILSSAEEILTRSRCLVSDFYQRDQSVYNVIAERLKDMTFLKEIYPELGDLNDELQRFYNLLPDLSATLSNLTGHVEYNEDELNQVETKLANLNRLSKKYKMNLDQLLLKRDELKAERELLKDMDFSLKEKEKSIAVALIQYRLANLQLREQRKKKALKLEKLIQQELAKLEMSRTRFVVNVFESEPTMDSISEKGTDRVEFYFSSNPGQEPGRIREIASGGELSRLMLVLKSIMGDGENSTYIFDEVDTGIGGKTAEFVGEKLKRISRNHQVICISHLPQIASFADQHFRVTKQFKQNQTFSYVDELNEEERIKEIGRLMVGGSVNGDVLKAARSLLEKHKSE